MVPVEWPLAATAADPPVEPPRARGSWRLSSVRRDFFLDPAHRLSEQERALMTAMLHDLVDALAHDVRSALHDHGDRSPAPSGLASRLTASGLLDREELVGLLLRRADEHRIATAFTGRAGPRKLPLLPRLVGDSDASVAAAAMALVVARGRRRDAFGQPCIELCDLSLGEAGHLVFAVAAAMAAEGGGDRAALADAAVVVVSGHDSDESLDAAVFALSAALGAGGRNDDALAQSAAEDGEVSLLAGLLAGRAGISPETSWGYLIGGQEGGLALLGRMAGLDRPTAARLVAEYGSLSGASVEDEIGSFDSLSDDEVQAALDWWRLPPDFRAAVSAVGGRIG